MRLPPEPLVIVVLAAVTGAAAIVDLRTRRVPNAMTFPLAVTGLALAITGLGRVGIGASLLGCAVGLMLMLTTHVLGATGAGDVKLFAAAGALLGPRATLSAFLYTAIAGAVIACVVAVRRRVVRQTLMQAAGVVRAPATMKSIVEHPALNNRFAYAPAIAIGTVAAALLG
jgi:prepilin peptidase CpaA